jgi:hypothetical protein
VSTTVNMRRIGHNLVAAAEWDGEALEALPENTDLKVKITRARSVDQNSMYWGLLRRVVREGPEWMSNQWPTADELSDALQLELGFVNQIKLPNGMVYGVPKSKSFENMSQTKFNTYFEAVLVKLNEWLGFEATTLLAA